MDVVAPLEWLGSPPKIVSQIKIGFGGLGPQEVLCPSVQVVGGQVLVRVDLMRAVRGR